MTDDNEAPGTIERADGHYEARLQRFIEHQQDAVWAMLTDPARIVEWLAPGVIELHKGVARSWTSPTTVSSSTARSASTRLRICWNTPGAGRASRSGPCAEKPKR